MSKDDILSILSNVKDEAKQKFKAEIKGIFGSVARGDVKSDSDIDVLVEFDEGANLLDMTGLSLFLEERLHCRVDIVPQSSIRIELKKGILKEAVFI